MANINPTIRVTTGKFNSVNDANCGGLSTSDSRGRAPGQLGQIVELSETEAQKMDSALHAGKYQYVLFKSGSSNSNAVGQLVSWYDYDDFIVTPDVVTSDAVGNMGNLAGVTLNAVTKGQYGFIQISGIATVKYRGTITKSGGADIGDNVIAVSDTLILADVLADATALTSVESTRKVGKAIAGATDGQSKLVQLALASDN